MEFFASIKAKLVLMIQEGPGQLMTRAFPSLSHKKFDAFLDGTPVFSWDKPQEHTLMKFPLQRITGRLLPHACIKRSLDKGEVGCERLRWIHVIQ